MENGQRIVVMLALMGASAIVKPETTSFDDEVVKGRASKKKGGQETEREDFSEFPKTDWTYASAPLSRIVENIFSAG